MVSVINDIDTAIKDNIQMRPGLSYSFTGQFELLERANQKLMLMVPDHHDYFCTALFSL